MTNIYRNSSSPFGYDVGEENRIDAYGVDHSNFSLRDEIEYQMARVNREDQFKQSYNKQGITDNYPQLGKSFWGNNSENNYGFGSSNISENIEQMKTNGMTYPYNKQSRIVPIYRPLLRLIQFSACRKE